MRLFKNILISVVFQGTSAFLMHLVGLWKYWDSVGLTHVGPYLLGIVGGICIYEWTPKWHEERAKECSTSSQD